MPELMKEIYSHISHSSLRRSYVNYDKVFFYIILYLGVNEYDNITGNVRISLP